MLETRGGLFFDRKKNDTVKRIKENHLEQNINILGEIHKLLTQILR